MTGLANLLNGFLHNPQHDVLAALHFPLLPARSAAFLPEFDGCVSMWHADNAMRPYVAFNAELRAAFQSCVARMEEACAALVRLVS